MCTCADRRELAASRVPQDGSRGSSSHRPDAQHCSSCVPSRPTQMLTHSDAHTLRCSHNTHRCSTHTQMLNTHTHAQHTHRCSHTQMLNTALRASLLVPQLASTCKASSEIAKYANATITSVCNATKRNFANTAVVSKSARHTHTHTNAHTYGFI